MEQAVHHPQCFADQAVQLFFFFFAYFYCYDYSKLVGEGRREEKELKNNITTQKKIIINFNLSVLPQPGVNVKFERCGEVVMLTSSSSNGFLSLAMQEE